MSSDINWRKSSYSGGSGGDCIEVGVSRAKATPSVLVRDTKNRDKAVLTFSAEVWQQFASHVKTT